MGTETTKRTNVTKSCIEQNLGTFASFERDDKKMRVDRNKLDFATKNNPKFIYTY